LGRELPGIRRGFGIGLVLLNFSGVKNQSKSGSCKRADMIGQSGIYVVPVLGHWRYKAVASESQRRVVLIGEGFGALASFALKRVVSVFPSIPSRPLPPLGLPLQKNQELESRVAQTEARMAYIVHDAQHHHPRPPTVTRVGVREKWRWNRLCEDTRLGGATCFYFYFFPLHVCLRFLTDQPTRHHGHCSSSQESRLLGPSPLHRGC
jgi:hypothetical protein